MQRFFRALKDGSYHSFIQPDNGFELKLSLYLVYGLKELLIIPSPYLAKTLAVSLLLCTLVPLIMDEFAARAS